jgi:hypothetical protein
MYILPGQHVQIKSSLSRVHEFAVSGIHSIFNHLSTNEHSGFCMHTKNNVEINTSLCTYPYVLMLLFFVRENLPKPSTYIEHFRHTVTLNS